MTKLILAAATAIALVSTASAAAEAPGAMVGADLPRLMETYRDLHQHPELSFQEVRSAAIMAAAARAAGFEVTEKVGKTGVVAVLRNGPGPTVLIRADMDALPVVEQTGLAFASKARGTSVTGSESGIMHACGHDTHMTSWIGAARLLAASRNKWQGTLVMIGQPAEEIGAGARAMIADGLLTRFPKPDYVLALHDSADIPAGVIGLHAGYALANIDTVDVTVRGVGGHGAQPHLTRDPVVLAAAIVMRLQTLVSREANPFEPSVVTVGSIHGGTKHNIIGEEVKLQLTVRSFSEASRRKLLDGIARIARGEAIAAGMPDDRMPSVTLDPNSANATWNTPELTERMGKLFRARFGSAFVAEAAPVAASEDVGEIARTDPQHIQSLIFWVGGRPAEALARAEREGRVLPGLHTPYWAPEADKVIATGAEALTVGAMDLMPRR
ncbi:MAG: amidohydrolase [Proteobacteria bacterium]|nr:amidohydrolase [Pseudomonadota bacterium]